MSLFSDLSFTFDSVYPVCCIVDASLEQSRISPIFLHAHRRAHLVQSHQNTVSTESVHGLFTTNLRFDVVALSVDPDVILGRDWLNAFLRFVKNPVSSFRHLS